MTDHEKLFRLLLKAFSLHSTIGLDWNDCSLFFPNVKFQEAVDYLLENGVTVKQMQKPLTVEEVRALPEVVWLEQRIGDGVEPKIPSGIEINAVTNNEYFNFSDDLYAAMSSYGKIWRCWKEKPTDEERKAAEWEK